MSKVYDYKTFNGEVFGAYVDTVSDLKRNELLKAGAFRVRNDLKASLSAQVGGNYLKVPMKAPVTGDADNYDGETNMTKSKRKTYSQGMVVVGRMHSWGENDFSSDITGGEDFMPIASEIAHWKDNVDQEVLLSILKGVFSMASGEGATFVTKHTNDISGEDDYNVVDATTLNTTIAKACGDNKGVFKVAIMHSQVATNLENLQLLQYLKYTDKDGIQRDLGLATWNGRIVLIDDNMPTETVEDSGSSYTKYTTYILGSDAFDYIDCGAKVPYSMDRDEETNGGETKLYVRQRKVFAPKGISYEPTSIPKSPENSDLELGTSWKIANDGQSSNTTYYPIKAIPIARIISRG